MSTVNKTVRLYAWQPNYVTFNIVEGEVDSRKFTIELYDTVDPVNLTNMSVQLYAEKPDGTQVYVDCKVVDISTGTVSVVLSEQMATAPGTVNCWIQVFGADGTDLRFEGMTIEVGACAMTRTLISASDFQVFKEAASKVLGTEAELRDARMGYNSLREKEASQDTQINTLTRNLKEVQTSGVTGEIVTEKVQSVIEEKMEDGTIAAMTIGDGSVSSMKLSGVTAFENNKIEFENSYINSTTGEIVEATSDYQVTRAYPVTAGEHVYMYGAYYNYDKKCVNAWYDEYGNFLSSFYNSENTKKFLTTEVPEGASFVRFTIPAVCATTFCFGNPLASQYRIDCTDDELNAVVASMVKDNMPEGCVDFSNLKFFKKIRKNKIDLEKRSPIMYDGALVERDKGGSYACDLEPGKFYKTKIKLTDTMTYLIFFDSDGKRLNTTKDNESAFESYTSESVNYQTEYTFSIPEGIASIIYCHNILTDYNYNNFGPLITEEADWGVSYDDANKVSYECTSDEFAQAMQNLTAVTGTLSGVEGKTVIFMGDSYTKGMEGYLSTMCSKLGLVADNRGVVSSSICGDEAGNKGFSPMWKRTENVCAKYSDAGTTSQVAAFVFMGGANDGFGVQTWIGSGINDTDTLHIYGAMHTVFNTVRKTFPDAKILTVLQPSSFNRTVSSITDDETAQVMGFKDLAELQKLDDYQFSNYAMFLKEKAVQEVAEFYNTEILDCCFNWHSVMNANDRTAYWNSDKLHLTAKGYQEITDSIGIKLKQMLAD